jgi:glycosyltransferase involved in cell wall biosynthesis
VKLSIIVPVYNERRTIGVILSKARAVSLSVEREIVVVDGASFDGTREILAEEAKQPDTRVILEPARRGRGRALKEGLAVATGDLADYPALLAPILTGDCDVVFGSRFLAGRPSMTFLQYWGNRVINIAVNLLYGTRLTDVETCYQVFRRDAVSDMGLENNNFAFTIELTVKLIRRGYRICEIPIQYVPRGRMEGKKIYWGDGFASLWTLLKHRFTK